MLMKIPLTKYGLPQMAAYPAALVVVMGAIALFGHERLPGPLFWSIEIIAAIILVWIFSFFRDPARTIPQEANILVSPADGTVSDVKIVENDYIGPETLQIGIFLSVFNVHINRAPCDVRIEDIIYKKGLFKDARHPDAGRVNESNAVRMTAAAQPHQKMIVTQISGAIARRIVCRTEKGDELKRGQQFGMIKFGSRTELYLPASKNAKCLVKPGDKVKAGQTILVRYEQ